MASSRATMALDNRRMSNAAARTPETQSGTESASVSPATTASTGSDDEIPDLDLQDDGEEEDMDKIAGNAITKTSSRGTNRTRKKGQKFQCTGYGDCNLTFTRSEHLSRHIRKHTGEKPYKCFCSRDFSRLDNLRQHAFTVHDPADIPPNWEHNAKGRNKGRKKEVANRKARLRPKPAVKTDDDLQTTPTQSIPQVQESAVVQSPSIPSHSHGALQHQSIPLQSPHILLHPHQAQLQPQQQQVQLPHQVQVQIQQQQPQLEQMQKPQIPIQQQSQIDQQQQVPRQHQTLPIHTVPSYPMYPDNQRQRPHSLHFQSSPLAENPFKDYRQTTPPHSPASTPQTPQTGPFMYGANSPLSTPTSAVGHLHPTSPNGQSTPLAWNASSRRQSALMRGQLRTPAEMEENRLKRATWHAGAEEMSPITGIVGSMEQTNLDDPRPKTRQRASTYIPAATPLEPPTVRPVLDEEIPRTLPPIQPWNFAANPPRMPEKRPGIGREHSRSRSASHIISISDVISSPRGYADTVAEQRGQRPPIASQRPRLSALAVAPRGPNADPNAIFSPQLKHTRRESFEGISPPRPLEPNIGPPLMLPNRARHSTGNPFISAAPPSDIYRPNRHSTYEGSWDHARMNSIESQVFESRPVETKAIPLDFLANICTEKIEEDKRQQASRLSSQNLNGKQ